MRLLMPYLTFVMDQSGIGHGILWKKICREIGAIPKARSKEKLNQPKNHYKYIDTCCCGITYKRHRISKFTTYRCPKCQLYS